MLALAPRGLGDASADQSSAGQVVAWLQSKWADFLALDPQMEDLQHQAAGLAYTATANGDAATASMLKDSITSLGDLRQLHTKAVSMFESLRDSIPSFSGLSAFPIVPIALVGAVLALGAMVTYIMTRETAEEKIIDGVNAGHMTPELAKYLRDQAAAAASKPDLLSEFSGTLKWIVVGVLGFMALKTLREFTT